MTTHRFALGLLPCLLAGLACGERAEPRAGQGAEQSGAELAAQAGPPAPAAETATQTGPEGCPVDTTPERRAFPLIETVLTWCVRTGPGIGRVQHGPWEKRRRGRVVESGHYRDGLRDGTWIVSWSSGEKQSEGEYRAGRKAGPWSFYDEEGELLRRVNYGDFAAAALESAEGEEAEAAPEEEKASTEVSLLVENSHGTEVVFALEPYAEEYYMPPGSVFEVSAVGPAPGDLVVESSEQAITVWAWEGSEVELRFNGEEVEP